MTKSNLPTATVELPVTPRARREWLRTLGTAARTPRGIVGLALLVIVSLVAFVGPFVAPHSPTEFVTLPFAPPSSSVPFGGDVLGRDVLSRVLNGGWLLLLMASAAAFLGVALGTTVGVTAGYRAGWPDAALMRGVDVILCLPQLVFALLLVSVIGPKLWLIVLAVGLSHAPQVARVMRSATLNISEQDYVKAVAVWGVPARSIMATEVAPNLVTPVMVETGLRFTYSIVIIAGLSFIGFGIQPPAANWAVMINENRIGLFNNPWCVLLPAVMIAVAAVGANTFTDAISRVAIGLNPSAEVELGSRPAVQSSGSEAGG